MLLQKSINKSLISDSAMSTQKIENSTRVVSSIFDFVCQRWLSWQIWNTILVIQFCCWVFIWSRFAVNKPFVNLVPATVMVVALKYSWEYIVPRCELLDKIANHKNGPQISICSSFYIYSSNASYCFSIKITFTLTWYYYYYYHTSTFKWIIVMFI